MAGDGTVGVVIVVVLDIFLSPPRLASPLYALPMDLKL